MIEGNTFIEIRFNCHDVFPSLVYFIIHSLPIKINGLWNSELFEDETVLRWDRFESVRKLGPLRSGFTAVRIVTGDTPRIHQLEQVMPCF